MLKVCEPNREQVRVECSSAPVILWQFPHAVRDKLGSCICPVWGNVLISTLMKTTMISFYRAFIKAGSWFGYLSVKNRNSLNHAVKWSSRPLGEPQQSPVHQLLWLAALILTLCQFNRPSSGRRSDKQTAVFFSYVLCAYQSWHS